jgi:hypothetical protein
MKKIAITLAFLLCAQFLFAQWSIGGQAAATFSNYKARTPWKQVNNTGFDVGLTAFKQLNNNLGLQLQLSYIRKGYFHKICNTIYDKLLANYIEIPVMLDYGFLLPMKNFKGHANFGFYTAYWMSAKYKTKGFDQDTESFDFKKNNASRFDFGPGIGGKIEYILNNGSIALAFRYEIGIMDLQKKQNDPTRNNNRALIIGLSYLKPLGR